MDIRTYILILTYFVIGRLIHEITEEQLRSVKLKDYTKQNWATLILDIVLWLPMLLIYIGTRIARALKK